MDVCLTSAHVRNEVQKDETFFSAPCNKIISEPGPLCFWEVQLRAVSGTQCSLWSWPQIHSENVDFQCVALVMESFWKYLFFKLVSRTCFVLGFSVGSNSSSSTWELRVRYC